MKKFRIIIDIIASIVGGVLWRLGGADNFSKGYRRYGVAGILAVLAFLKTRSKVVVLLSYGLLVASTSLGYGESSALALFWNNLGVYSETMLDIAIRGSVGLLYGLAYLPTVIYLKKYKWLPIILVPMILCPAIRFLGNITGAVVEEALMGAMVIGVYCLLPIKKLKEK